MGRKNNFSALEERVAAKRRYYQRVLLGLLGVLIAAIIVFGLLIVNHNRLDKVTDTPLPTGPKAKYQAKSGDFRFNWTIKDILAITIDQKDSDFTSTTADEIADSYGQPSSVEYYEQHNQLIFQYDQEQDPRYKDKDFSENSQSVRLGFFGSGDSYYLNSITADDVGYSSTYDFDMLTKEEFDALVTGEQGTTLEDIFEKFGYPSLYTKSYGDLSISYSQYPKQAVLQFEETKDKHIRLSKKNYYGEEAAS
ncbi:hypothetical protein [Streptococcus dentiloxodontae]